MTIHIRTIEIGLFIMSKKITSEKFDMFCDLLDQLIISGTFKANPRYLLTKKISTKTFFKTSFCIHLSDYPEFYNNIIEIRANHTLALMKNNLANDEIYINLRFTVLDKNFKYKREIQDILDNPNDFSEHMRNFVLFNLELL